MYIIGQIRIFNALNSDGYSTGNAPPSGNNVSYCFLWSGNRFVTTAVLGVICRIIIRIITTLAEVVQVKVQYKSDAAIWIIVQKYDKKNICLAF